MQRYGSQTPLTFFTKPAGRFKGVLIAFGYDKSKSCDCGPPVVFYNYGSDNSTWQQSGNLDAGGGGLLGGGILDPIGGGPSPATPFGGGMPRTADVYTVPEYGWLVEALRRAREPGIDYPGEIPPAPPLFPPTNHPDTVGWFDWSWGFSYIPEPN